MVIINVRYETFKQLRAIDWLWKLNEEEQNVWWQDTSLQALVFKNEDDAIMFRLSFGL